MARAGDIVSRLVVDTGGWLSGFSKAIGATSKFATDTISQLNKTSKVWVDYKKASAAAVAAQAKQSAVAATTRRAELQAQSAAAKSAARITAEKIRLKQQEVKAQIQASRAIMQQRKMEYQQAKSLRNIEKQVSKGPLGGGVMGRLGQIGLASQGLSAMSSAFRSTAGSAVALAADLEQTQISFEVLLGSADKATGMIASMRQLAASSPLQFTDVQKAGKTLLSFGAAAQNVMPSLRMLGDVSGGNSERFQSLSLAFGQMSSAGRLMGQDLLQFINAGFNPLQQISKTTGKSMVQLKKEMEAGAISSQMVMQAFKDATSEGGLFFGMLDRQSKTTSGLWAKLQDGVSQAMTDIGKAIIQGFNLNGVMVDANTMLERFRAEWLPGITGAINDLGAQFGRFVEALKAGWGKWLYDSSIATAKFFSVLDLRFQIAQQWLALWVSNGTSLVTSFFLNFNQNASHMGKTFLNALTQMGKGLMDFRKGMFNALAGRAAGALAAGAVTLPALQDADLKGTTPLLQKLQEQLATALQKQIATGPTASPLEGLDFGSAVIAAPKGTAQSSTAAMEAGSREAASTISRAFNDRRNESLKVAQQQLKETQKQTTILQTLERQIPGQSQMMPAMI